MILSFCLFLILFLFLVSFCLYQWAGWYSRGIIIVDFDSFFFLSFFNLLLYLTSYFNASYFIFSCSLLLSFSIHPSFYLSDVFSLSVLSRFLSSPIQIYSSFFTDIPFPYFNRLRGKHNTTTHS